MSPSIKLVYEDSILALFRKPSNLHTLEGEQENSVIKEIKNYFPQFINKLPDNGLMQRLDYETSGLLLMSKDKDTFDNIKEQFKSHKIEKKYYALCEGQIKTTLSISGYTGSRYRGSQRASFSNVSKERFLFASAVYQPIKQINSQCTLLNVTTCYGRRHQVRLLAAELGHPLCGDTLYGAKTDMQEMLPKLSIPQFLLDAYELSLIYPSSGQRVSYTGGLPEYLVKLMQDDNA